jgi:SAM-dependent methyltransferase
MKKINIKSWETQKFVNKYKNYSLYEAEKVLFEKFNKNIENKEILDIGTGRTSFFLLKKTKKYLGFDYSKKMIEKCKKNFPTNNKKFKVLDVCKMNFNKKFDFIFFSYNGIDCIESLNKRKECLKRINKHLKTNGVFLFSFHNLIAYKKNWKKPTLKRLVFRLFYPWNFLIYLEIIKNFIKFKKKEVFKKDYEIFMDGANFFSILNLYMKPKFQIEILKELGFSNIKIYSNEGMEIKNEKDFELKENLFLYIACKKINQDGEKIMKNFK